MSLASLAVFASLTVALFGQSGKIMSGSGSTGEFSLTYETRLEPPSPPMSGIGEGGVLSGKAQMHRYIMDSARRVYFGYDVSIARGRDVGSCLVTFRPLSMTSEKLTAKNGTAWKKLPLSGYPAPQSVHFGDTIALDLLTNPATGQKIVDYIRIQQIHVVATSRDLRLISVTKTVAAAGKTVIRLRNEYSQPATAYDLMCSKSPSALGGRALQWFDADITPDGKRLAPGEETEFSPERAPTAQKRSACDDFRVIAAVFADGTVSGDWKWIGAIMERRQKAREDIAKATEILNKAIASGAGLSGALLQLEKWRNSERGKNLPAATLLADAPGPPFAAGEVASTVVSLLDKKGKSLLETVKLLSEWRDKLGDRNPPARSIAVGRTVAPPAESRAAAPAPDAKQLLKEVAQTYKQLKSYRFEAVRNLTGEETRLVTAAVRPDKRRVENHLATPAFRSSVLNAQASDPSGYQSSTGQPVGSDALRVFDGQTVWEYRFGSNQYTRQPQASYKAPTPDFARDPVDRYERLDAVANARYLREETLEIGGAKVECHVVEVAPPVAAAAPVTYWIDKARHLVLQETTTFTMNLASVGRPSTRTTTNTTYVVAKIDEPVPDALFQFSPPEGATEVTQFDWPPRRESSDLVGKPAPDFTLLDVDGRRVALKELRGKAVFLAFCATWAPPCLGEMPQVKALQDEFKDKGLVVLAINSTESAEVARRYFEEEQYDFANLLDPGKLTFNKYGATGIPKAVLIDKDGVIRYLHQGFSARLDFRAEVMKLGLK